MTYQEFEQNVKKKTGFDRYWYYGLSISVIILSLVLLFIIVTQPEKLKGNHLFYYSGFTFLLILGAYGLYKLPNRYKIVTITSSQTLAKKKAAIDTFLSKMNIIVSLNDNYCSFTYRKKFWSSTYKIYIFYDNNSVRFSVQGHDYSDGGFIDFGGTEKLRKRISDDIQALLR